MTAPADSAARRTAGWVLALSGLGFVLLAWWLIPWDWLPGGRLAHVAPSEVFSARQIDLAEEYSDRQWDITWLSLGVSLVLALVLGLTPVGARLVRRLPGPWWLRTVLGTLLVLVLAQLVTLPFDWWAHRVDQDYGLTQQPALGWLRDHGLALLVTWVFTAFLLLVVIGLARRMPRRWPAVAAVLAGVLVVLGSFVYPVVVEPLFNSFTPMKGGPLKSQILRLADREDVHVDDVLVADASRRTTRLNAYVSGFGSTRRIVVYDTLLKGLPREQVLVVVAHELAHAKHRDVAVGTALGALGAAFGIGLLGLLLTTTSLRRRAGVAGIADPAVVPLLLLLLSAGSLAAAPVQNTISRAMEAHADRTSLEVTGEYDAFTRMQRQLAVRSLSDPTPPAWRQWWFGSHPTTLQRIGMAEEMARANKKAADPIRLRG